MSTTSSDDPAAPMRDPRSSLVRAIDEAAATPVPPGGPLRRVGSVVEALADASLEMRRTYWGYPHPGSVGDRPLVVVVDGRDFAVSSVAFEDDRIQIDVEPMGSEARVTAEPA